ncbi:MAG: hypothetical protein R3181_06410 [Rubricoccaceae bacterium]|nr:hypothetical protein [Rubricoccaceae bacterium]
MAYRTPGSRRWALGGLLAATAALPAAGQEARLHVLADSVSLGERFAVAVAVEHQGTGMTFPEVPAGDPEAGTVLQFGDAEVFSLRRLPPRLDGAARMDSVVYEAATFALDRATVGPIVVGVLAEGDTVEVATGTRAVPVRSELFSMESELLPPLPPEPFPRPWPLYALIGAAVLLLLGLVWWAVRRRRRRSTPAAGGAAPYPEALSRLDALGDPQAPGAVKPHYVELSALLRRYLARSLGLPALELTTRELVHALRRDARLPDAAVSAVRGTLRLCDLVKFADLRPNAEAHGAARAKAREALDAVEAALRPPPDETDGGEPENAVAHPA